ncbi:hypothetical protein NXS19_014246 [Fusarium pseudograminearum]|nr:hypothetical protein NXS19_014246 [Fusarium pseudograminearum]
MSTSFTERAVSDATSGDLPWPGPFLSTGQGKIGMRKTSRNRVQMVRVQRLPDRVFKDSAPKVQKYGM